jgi:hypothetical protein
MGWIEDNTRIDSIAKVGMRIRLKEMPNDPNPIDEDMEGTIRTIDSLGTLHVVWDDGSQLGVIPGIDKYELLTDEFIDDPDKFIGMFGEGSDFKLSNASKKISRTSPTVKNFRNNFKKEFSSVRPKPDIKIESEDEELDETMTAGGGGGLAGASGYSYVGPLGSKKNESKIIKAKNFLKETTTASAIQAPSDFIIANLLGWGTLEDLSPPWPSPKKLADNRQKENWWWQKIPIYNGGVITDPYAKTDETWDDDALQINIDQNLSAFKSDIEKNPKKYKQDTINVSKAFNANVDGVGNRWVNYSDDERIVVVKEAKEKSVHKVKWDRCVKDVEEKNKKNKTDYNPYAVCTKSIGYEGSIKKKHRRKEVSEEDVNETTTFSSVFGGNFPVTPFMFAKKGKHIPSKKPLWKGGQIVQKVDKADLLGESILDEINKIKWVKGGKYVKIKDKCAKYNNQPWCSQGAIDNPLELSDTTFENIKRVSKKTGLPEEVILERILKKMGYL